MGHLKNSRWQQNAQNWLEINLEKKKYFYTHHSTNLGNKCFLKYGEFQTIGKDSIKTL